MRGMRDPALGLGRFAVLFLGPALALALMAEEIAERETFHIDHVLTPGIGPLHSEPLAILLGIFTVIGGGIGLTTLAAFPVGYLASRRRLAGAVFVTIALGGAWAMDRILKHWFSRSRPDATTPIPQGLKQALALVLVIALVAAWRTRWRRVAVFVVGAFVAIEVMDEILRVAIPLQSGHDSFPSGHAVSSMTFAAALVAVTWHTRRRWEFAGGGLVFVLIVGVSRIYFGLHYATDILGGWCLAIAWTALLARLFSSRLRRESTAESSAELAASH